MVKKLIYTILDKGKHSATFYLDLVKAFDSVDDDTNFK